MSGADARLAELQARLRPLGDAGEPGRPGRTIVLLPSIDVDSGLLRRHADQLPALEERGLYMLFLLRRPGLRVVLLTSRPVDERILDSYLALVPGPGGADARARLVCLSPDDGSPRPLAQKVLERENLVARVREAVGGADGLIAPYSVGAPERDLALRLDLPLYGPEPRFAAYGTKVGGRRLFAEEGVAHPDGIEEVGDPDGVVAAIVELRARRPGLGAVVVKHNESAYGEGNAVLRLAGLPEPGAADERDALLRLVTALPDAYLDGLAASPGIVEEMIAAAEVRSPSVQMRIIAGGAPGLVSSHDQIMGGPDGQMFVGCRFPADPRYAVAVGREAEKVRGRLAREGVVGRFGVDFVVARDAAGAWRPYAVEINLREGGTSHPFGALYLLTGARYDESTGVCLAPDGSPRHYVATDALADQAWRGVDPAAVLAAVERENLAFDHATGTGAVLHMLSALRDEGLLGLTAIATSPSAAADLYDRVRRSVDALARDPGLVG